MLNSRFFFLLLASIKPNDYTKTVGIGESVTLSVTSTVKDNLRWILNNGEILTEWNDQTDVRIDNVRLADAGIYECFEDGQREMGQHAIMRLIIRGIFKIRFIVLLELNYPENQHKRFYLIC